MDADFELYANSRYRCTAWYLLQRHTFSVGSSLIRVVYRGDR